MVGFIVGCCVHSDAPWRSLCLSCVFGFTLERFGGLLVHAGSLGSSGVVDFTRVRAGGR